MSKVFKIFAVFTVALVCSVCNREPVTAFAPDRFGRVIAVGDLPEGHDPSLVLRKGRIIRVRFSHDIKNEKPLEGRCYLSIKENTYDDTGQYFLMPKKADIYCFYEISEVQDKIKIYITAIRMNLEPLNIATPAGGVFPTIIFTDPPRYTTLDGWKTLANKSSSDVDIGKRFTKIDFIQLREQLFLSPVISAELVLDVESEDITSPRGSVKFGENASGERTISIEYGYEVDLEVKKDILFSEPYVDIYK